jgi:hypothetical protein
MGSIIAPAQIDSGFSETSRVRGVVQINDALFADLRNAGIAMIPFAEIRFSSRTVAARSLFPRCGR